MKQKLILLSLVFLFAAGSPSVSAFDDGSFEAVAADAVVVRPLSFVATVLGTALFVVSLPVAAISDSTSQAAEALVLRPGRMTFTRPLGDLSSLID